MVNNEEKYFRSQSPQQSNKYDGYDDDNYRFEKKNDEFKKKQSQKPKDNNKNKHQEDQKYENYPQEENAKNQKEKQPIKKIQKFQTQNITPKSS